MSTKIVTKLVKKREIYQQKLCKYKKKSSHTTTTPILDNWDT